MSREWHAMLCIYKHQARYAAISVCYVSTGSILYVLLEEAVPSL